MLLPFPVGARTTCSGKNKVGNSIEGVQSALGMERGPEGVGSPKRGALKSSAPSRSDGMGTAGTDVGTRDGPETQGDS